MASPATALRLTGRSDLSPCLTLRETGAIKKTPKASRVPLGSRTLEGRLGTRCLEYPAKKIQPQSRRGSIDVDQARLRFAAASGAALGSDERALKLISSRLFGRGRSLRTEKSLRVTRSCGFQLCALNSSLPPQRGQGPGLLGCTAPGSSGINVMPPTVRRRWLACLMGCRRVFGNCRQHVPQVLQNTMSRG